MGFFIFGYVKRKPQRTHPNPRCNEELLFYNTSQRSKIRNEIWRKNANLIHNLDEGITHLKNQNI